MSMKQAIALLLYAFDVALCLFNIKRKNSRVYTATKPFLMPLLLAVYLLFLPEGAMGRNSQILVVLALGFHTLGDIFLLFPRNRSRQMFYLGMLCFFVGHISYALWFAKADIGHSAKAAVVAVFVALAFQYMIFRQLVLGPRKYAPKLMPYTFGLMAVFVSIASTLGHGSPVYATLLSLVGIALFTFSDFCIMRRMVRLPLFGQMTVMSTYILGQSLIIAGMLLMQKV
ncbi:MAG: hypothetical protein IJ863_01035 [Spirochaetales bacterium]|nr:hypothetical protein [Spirochaetales bacterium]